VSAREREWLYVLAVTDREENSYDLFAVAYTADTEDNAWNAYYERPAVLAMVGDIAGKRVLDAGCGAGNAVKLETRAGTLECGSLP